MDIAASAALDDPNAASRHFAAGEKQSFFEIRESLRSGKPDGKP